MAKKPDSGILALSPVPLFPVPFRYDRPVMVYEAEAGQRRWLMKAVRESTGELFAQFQGLSEAALCWRPAEGELCLKEVAAHLRDAETLYQHQIELIAREFEPRLPHESIDVLPFEQDYRDQRLSRLLGEYESAREETVWVLRMLSDEEWQRTGQHPYRGSTSIYDIVRELHQHDLEHLYEARNLRALVERLRV
jgi:hypothetical protein